MIRNKFLVAFSMAAAVGLTACGGEDQRGSSSDTESLVVDDAYRLGEDPVYQKGCDRDAVAGEQGACLGLGFEGDVAFNDNMVGAQYTVSRQPAHGTVTLDDEGLFLYVPDADYFGSDSFEYTATRIGDEVEAAGEVTFTIIQDNADNPVDSGYTNVESESDDFDPSGLSAMWDLSGGETSVVESRGIDYLGVSLAAGSSEFTLQGAMSATLTPPAPGKSIFIQMRVSLPAGDGVETLVGLRPQETAFDGPGMIAAASVEDFVDLETGSYRYGVVYGNDIDQSYDYLDIPEAVKTLPEDVVPVPAEPEPWVLDPSSWRTYAIELSAEQIKFYLSSGGQYYHMATVNRSTLWTYTLNEEGVATPVTDGLFDQPLVPFFSVAVDDGATPTGPLLLDYFYVYECLQERCVNNFDTPAVDGLAPRGQAAELVVTQTTSFYGDAGAALLTWVGTEEAYQLSVETTVADGGVAPVVTDVDSNGDELIEYLSIAHTSTDAASVAIVPPEGDEGPEPLEITDGLNRMLTFDLYVADGAVETMLDVIMASGEMDYGVLTWDLADITPDQWISYSIPLQDFLDSPFAGGAGLDLSSVTALLEFDFDAPLTMWVRDVALSCLTSEPCGILSPAAGGGAIGEGGPQTMLGGWSLAPIEAALGVGPAPGDVGWWFNSEEAVDARACHFDDVYRFTADGTFSLDLGDETWLEPWQGVEEGCGAPISPHLTDDYTYTFTPGEPTEDGAVTGQLTLNGTGAHMGLPKAVNDEELTSPGGAPASVTYEVVELTDTSLSLYVDSGGVFWNFEFVRVEEAVTPLGDWSLAPVEAALGVGPAPGDVGWWFNSEEAVDARSCHFDDVYTFAEDGTFRLELGDETWLEPWQGVEEGCGAPISPHLSDVYTYTWVEGEPNADGDATGLLTLEGTGAHMGLPKAVNGEELTSPGGAPSSVAYEVTSLTGTTMTLVVDSGGVFWNFQLARPQ